jgi:hypothetical protein
MPHSGALRRHQDMKIAAVAIAAQLFWPRWRGQWLGVRKGR